MVYSTAMMNLEQRTRQNHARRAQLHAMAERLMANAQRRREAGAMFHVPALLERAQHALELSARLSMRPEAG